MIELARRAERNERLISNLREGRPVIFRSESNTLWPRVSSNDLCTFDPVWSEDEVQEDDIFLWAAQPGDRIHTRSVGEKLWLYQPCKNAAADQYVYTVSKFKGRENGWCLWRHIYGKLVEVRGAIVEYG